MLQAQLRTKQCVGPHMSILLEIELYVTHAGISVYITLKMPINSSLAKKTADHDHEVCIIIIIVVKIT